MLGNNAHREQTLLCKVFSRQIIKLSNRQKLRQ